VQSPTSSEPSKTSEEPQGGWLSQLLPGIAVVFIVAVVGFLGIRWYTSRNPSLNGGLLNPPAPAPNFQLEDQNGQNISLSQFRGKVVVLTFLYTHCPDACPIITEKLHQAYTQLGPDTAHVAILAVTVDPERDTMAQVRAYSAEKDMLQKWHFLVGPMAQVAPVWKLYGVASVPQTSSTGSATATTSGSGVPVAVTATSALLNHSDPIFVIDPAGRERTILDVNFNPSELVDDVHALLAGT